MRAQTIADVSVSRTTGAQAPRANTGQALCQFTASSQKAHHNPSEISAVTNVGQESPTIVVLEKFFAMRRAPIQGQP
jgi:hypothetical protein